MTADSSGLGTKPVARLALTMSVPTIVAQAANASYTIIDRLFIGHIPEVGDAAMTGVGICFPILLAVTAFASLIGAGGAPRASIELGRGNFKKAERILGTSAAFLVAIALTLTVILQATKEPVLRAFGASDANIGYAYRHSHRQFPYKFCKQLCGPEYGNGTNTNPLFLLHSQ